ncbi:MAG: chemotaxis protein CheR, partial [Deltaproteobacteria bacterium]|nr:chemotaxis protein CheR [Deltaproteobacteria bacterium]
AIKEAGGMVMTQDEASAKFDGMPRSSIATGLVDFVMPPEDMPDQLLKYIRHPYAQGSEAQAPALVNDDDSLARVLGLVQRSSGVDFTFYKSNTIARRIERRMSVNQILALADYVRYLESSPREVGTLYKDLLIGVTSFFRDPPAFETLRTKILPGILDNLAEPRSARAWVAGCSTGEEAYSLAILMREHIEASGKACNVKVFATDIDRDALDYASVGAYPESIAADVSRERLSRFFVKRGDSYQVIRPLREMVIFAKHNLLRDPPFTKVDLVSCRNLLIYLQAPVQKKVLSFFDFSIKPGGALFLGPSETIGDLTSQFEPVENRWKIYRSRGGVRKLLPNDMELDARREKVRPAAFRARPGFRVPDDERGRVALYQSLLEEHLPPSVVVDEHYDILHVLRDVSDYVRLPVGKLTFNVLKSVPKDLSSALNTALHKASKGAQEVLYQNVQFGEPDARRRVNLRVKPFEDRRGQRLYYTVIFEDPEAKSAVASASEVLDSRDTSG